MIGQSRGKVVMEKQTGMIQLAIISNYFFSIWITMEEILDCSISHALIGDGVVYP